MSFIRNCLYLFRSTLNAAFQIGILRFFAVVLLFLSVVNLLSLLVRRGRSGKFS